jgi:hypothetical protein
MHQQGFIKNYYFLLLGATKTYFRNLDIKVRFLNNEIIHNFSAKDVLFSFRLSRNDVDYCFKEYDKDHDNRLLTI